jgi:hypothetical protein
MTVEQLAELVIRPVSASIRTDEDRFDIDYVLAIIDVAAAWAKGEKYKKDRQIPNEWLYTKHLTYNKFLQESTDYITFEIPRKINIDGTSITLVKGEKGREIPIYKSLAEYLGLTNHPFFKFKGNEQVAVIDGKKLRIYGYQALKNIEVKGLFTDILNDSEYNLIFDEYPITEDIVWLINTFIINQYTNTGKIRPVDMISDGRDVELQQPGR